MFSVPSNAAHTNFLLKQTTLENTLLAAAAFLAFTAALPS